MNKKFKSLKNRILLLIFTIILLTVISILLSVFYQYSTNNFDKIANTLGKIDKYIIQLKNTEQDFLLNFNKSTEFYISSDNRLENAFRASYNNLKSIIDSVSGLGIVKNKAKALEQIEHLQEDLQLYSENFNELVLAYKEKEYLLGKHPKLINELSYLSNDIQGSLSLNQNNDSILNDISNDLNKYVETARKISSIDERIGISSKTGIIYNLNNTYIRLSESAYGLSAILKKKINSKQTGLYIILISAIILLLAGLIFFIQKMFRLSLFHPLTEISNYLSQLARGKLPDNRLELKINNELSSLSESINVLTDNYKSKMSYAHDLNEGLLDSKIDILSEDDILGKELMQLHNNIQKSVEEQKNYNEDNTKRRYINEGLAKFSEILRVNSDNIDRLSDIFIKEMVKYLNALQGGLFLMKDLDEENRTLELKSAFAYNRKKYIDKEILLGEGLVGTCAIEKKTIVMTEIPQEYISITSGLGDTPPDNLILLPVSQEDTILGVIEVASLNKFQKHEIDFSEQVASSLASTVTAASNSDRTAKLLAKSQSQAQEMLEQEEEMRQNMEELKATQEESVRREEEYRGIIGAVQDSVFIVEYDLEGNITDINDKFLVFLGKSKKNLLGKKHSDLISRQSSSDINASFWKDIKQGKNKKIIEKVKIGRKREYVLMNNFSPVLNNDKVPVKILNIIVEITAAEEKRIGK